MTNPIITCKLQDLKTNLHDSLPEDCKPLVIIGEPSDILNEVGDIVEAVSKRRYRHDRFFDSNTELELDDLVIDDFNHNWREVILVTNLSIEMVKQMLPKGEYYIVKFTEIGNEVRLRFLNSEDPYEDTESPILITDRAKSYFVPSEYIKPNEMGYYLVHYNTKSLKGKIELNRPILDRYNSLFLFLHHENLLLDSLILNEFEIKYPTVRIIDFSVFDESELTKEVIVTSLIEITSKLTKIHNLYLIIIGSEDLLTNEELSKLSSLHCQ